MENFAEACRRQTVGTIALDMISLFLFSALPSCISLIPYFSVSLACKHDTFIAHHTPHSLFLFCLQALCQESLIIHSFCTLFVLFKWNISECLIIMHAIFTFPFPTS